jgi:hypothetical protein
MSAPARIAITETGNELLIRNPPRRSTIRVGFLVISIAIVVITAKWGLLDRSPETIAMGLFGLTAFLAIFGLFAYFLGKELSWLASGGEALRITRDSVSREVRGAFPNRASLSFRGPLSATILDHPYPTDETGLEEVMRLTSTGGSISFGRELSRPEAEAVADAVSRFTTRNNSRSR